MKSKRKQQVIRYRSKKRSSISQGAEVKYFDVIPVDLIIRIMSRLPLKSIAQLRCVSKLWSTIIRRPNYDLLFPIKSLASPRLLFSFKVAEDLFFKSSPQPQNPYMNTSLVTTRHHTNTDRDICRLLLSRPVCGLVCRQHVQKYDSWAVISNPITGESLTLPKLSLDWMNSDSESLYGQQVIYCFGYDPIDKELKVLRITWFRCGQLERSVEYHVLTLGTAHLSWRRIQCCTLHYPLEDNGICINGVFYYPARLNDGKRTMVCFDVRSIKFSFIDIGQDMSKKISQPFTFSLIDYKGKLGACNCKIYHPMFLGFELWVLEEAKEHRWSKHIYKMSHPWPIQTSYVLAGGVIASGEIVLHPFFIGKQCPFILFYNLESNVITRVMLEVPVYKRLTYDARLYTFSNYVEHVTLI